MALLGVGGTPLRWFENYLSNREYSISIGGELSQKRKMERGLPQGSILSPILFNIPANSIPTVPYTSQIIYADDKKIYCRGKTLEEVEQKLQHAIGPLEQWLEDTALTAETSKCKIMLWTHLEESGKRTKHLLKWRQSRLHQTTQITRPLTR